MRKITFLLVLLLSLVVLTAPAHAETYKGFPTANITIEGRQVQSDVPAIIVDGRVMVPLRAVADNVGVTAEWSGASNTVTLFTNKVLKTPAEVDAKFDNWLSKRDMLVDRETGIINNINYTNELTGDKLYVLASEYAALLREIFSTKYHDPSDDQQGAIDSMATLVAGDYFRCKTAVIYFQEFANESPQDVQILAEKAYTLSTDASNGYIDWFDH